MLALAKLGKSWLGSYAELERTKFSYKIGYSLSLQATTLLNKINITIYFENLTIRFHVFYTLNIHIKLCVNQILFTI